jgi:hypothetical protein
VVSDNLRVHATAIRHSPPCSARGAPRLTPPVIAPGAAELQVIQPRHLGPHVYPLAAPRHLAKTPDNRTAVPFTLCGAAAGTSRPSQARGGHCPSFRIPATAGWLAGDRRRFCDLASRPRRVSCARLRFSAAIKSTTGRGGAISLGLTGRPLIFASINSRSAS